MKGKPKLSKLSAADEASVKGKSVKARAAFVKGEPDMQDYLDLKLIFDEYDKATGGKLQKAVGQNRIENAAKYGSAPRKDIQSAENLSFFLPQELQQYIEQYWPTIWTNPDHLRWFLEVFPMFRT